jgi:hypothetical protein
MAESYYVNKDALRTVIKAHTPRFTTPTYIEIANHLRGLMSVIDLMPTLTKDDIYRTAELVWWEDWEPASGECPKELVGAGWKCSHCEEDMGEYLTKHSGERCYFDKYEEKPTLAFCPCCGRKFN